jgi:hypothetical protein
MAQVAAAGGDLSARGGDRADTSRARRDAGASLAWAMCGAGRGTGRAFCAQQRLGTGRTASVVCCGAGSAGAGRGEPGTDPSRSGHPYGYRAGIVTTALICAAGRGGGARRSDRGGWAPVGRGPGGIRDQRAGRHARGGLPAPGRVAAAPRGRGGEPIHANHRSGGVFSSGPYPGPKPIGQILETADGAEPESAVAATRQATGG